MMRCRWNTRHERTTHSLQQNGEELAVAIKYYWSQHNSRNRIFDRQDFFRLYKKIYKYGEANIERSCEDDTELNKSSTLVLLIHEENQTSKISC